MRPCLICAVGLLLVCTLSCQPSALPDKTAATGKTEGPVLRLTSQVVEASCGECQFSMPGNSCDLAIRVDGKTFFVDGSGLDDHGDAHAADGMCSCVRQARVTGEVKNGRFLATAFELLPMEKK